MAEEFNERRIIDEKFKLDIIARLHRLEDDRLGYHRENQMRLEHLERAADGLEPIVRQLKPLIEDWTGGDDPNNDGMRGELKKMIAAQRTIRMGWRMLLALGSLVAALFVTMQAIEKWFSGKA